METKNSKLISVIVPCFNSGNILKRAIDSVINQTWQEIEIILVNDGSDDEKTLKIINDYRNLSKLKLINQNNLGLSAARNSGVKNANGNYLFFLDSDDWIEPQAMELMFDFHKENHEKGFVFSDIILEGEVHKKINKNYNFFEQLFINQLPYSIFISKEVWVKNGGYDERMRNGYEDWDFNIRLGASHVYGKRLPKYLFHYNVSNSGMLISKSSKNHSTIWKYIIKKNHNLYSIKRLFIIWKEWRKVRSSYHSILLLVLFFIIKIFPENLTSKLFILIRNLKWSFTRNKNIIKLCRKN